MSTPLQALRDAMTRNAIDACIIPTADYHNSEYVGDHFAFREYVSGFTGSAGPLLVFPGWAGLWTDGRYFLQAERQLEGTGIKLMKMGEPGVPTISDFLRSSLQPGQTLCFDSRCVTAATARRYYALAKQKGVKIRDREELMDQVWLDRPPRPAAPVWALPAGLTGTTRREKLDRVRSAVAKEAANTLLLTALEDFADGSGNPEAILYLIPATRRAAALIRANRDRLDPRYVIASPAELRRLFRVPKAE